MFAANAAYFYPSCLTVCLDRDALAPATKIFELGVSERHATVLAFLELHDEVRHRPEHSGFKKRMRRGCMRSPDWAASDTRERRIPTATRPPAAMMPFMMSVCLSSWTTRPHQRPFMMSDGAASLPYPLLAHELSRSQHS